MLALVLTLLLKAASAASSQRYKAYAHAEPHGEVVEPGSHQAVQLLSCRC